MNAVALAIGGCFLILLPWLHFGQKHGMHKDPQNLAYDSCSDLTSLRITSLCPEALATPTTCHIQHPCYVMSQYFGPCWPSVQKAHLPSSDKSTPN